MEQYTSQTVATLGHWLFRQKKKHTKRINHEMNDKPNCVPHVIYSFIYTLYRLNDDNYMHTLDMYND